MPDADPRTTDARRAAVKGTLRDLMCRIDAIGWALAHHTEAPRLSLSLDEALALSALVRWTLEEKPMTETADPRWQWQQRWPSIRRWTEAEIAELKGELDRRTCFDPLWQVCADVIGSLQCDLIDVQRGRK